MFRTVLMGALALVCCSCINHRPSFPPGDEPPRRGEEIWIGKRHVKISRDHRNILILTNPWAVPVPDLRSTRYPGAVYLLEGSFARGLSVECEYPIEEWPLDVSDLKDHINSKGLSCSVLIPGSPRTALELSPCLYNVIIVLKEKGSGISITLRPGESADLADPATISALTDPVTSSHVALYSVVE